MKSIFFSPFLFCRNCSDNTAKKDSAQRIYACYKTNEIYK